MRFLTEVDASVIAPDLSSDLSNEKIIVQGAVDVCFEGTLKESWDNHYHHVEIENGNIVFLAVHGLTCPFVFLP